ncbi:MAG: signal peptidase II [Patescibacteria group bacterium]|nr:signal peptidase II [Patescibacteria group bacterium]
MRKKEREVIGGILVLDQLSKYFFFKSEMAVINQGVSFSLLSHCSIVSLLGLTFFCLFLLHFYKGSFGVKLMMIGGLSNLFDRFFYEGIVDFIRLPYLPVFNLADIAIVTGTLFFAVDLIKAKSL